MNMAMKRKKRTFAIVVAVPCTPLNPKIPAIIAIIKKITAHTNIVDFPFWLL